MGGKSKRLSLTSLMLICLLALGMADTPIFNVQDAHAVPVFARKYQTSCMTCKVGFPKLNAFGRAFKNNGYRLPADEVFVKEPPVWLGAEASKRIWPDAVWPSTIPGNVPIGLRIHGQFDYDPSLTRTSGKGKSEFDFPHEVEFFSIGNIGDNMSFNLIIALQDGSSRTAIETAFFEYNDILTGHYGVKEDNLNMRVGLFEPEVIPFAQMNQRLGISRPTLTDFRISGGSQPRLRDRQSGVELHGTLNKRLRYATGVVNGDAESGSSDAFSDNNTEKDFYGRIEYKFGGLPSAGIAEADEISPSIAPYFDQGPAVTVGTSGYWGVNQIDAATDTDSEYYRVLGFVRANRDRYNVDLVYLHQQDDEAAGQFNGTDDDKVTSNGFYIEGSAFIKPWAIVQARYDHLNIEHVTTLGASNPTDNVSRLTLTTPIYFRPNVRLVPEASLGLADEDDQNVSDNYTVRLDFAW